MSKDMTPSEFARPATTAKLSGTRLRQRLRVVFAGLMIAGLALAPSLVPLAQHLKDSQSPVKVTDVSARQTTSGAVVTVSADAPLSRTQTWQDGDKFHLVLPYAGSDAFKNLPRGVKVNRVSNSLEIVVNLKSGASVTVDPRFNHLNLIVNGGLNQTQKDVDDNVAPQSARAVGRSGSLIEDKLAARTSRERGGRTENVAPLTFFSVRPAMKSNKPVSPSSAPQQAKAFVRAPEQGREKLVPVEKSAEAPAAIPPSAPAALPPSAAASTQDIPPAETDAVAATPEPTSDSAPVPQAQPVVARSFFSILFSTTGVALMIALGLMVLAYLRVRPNAEEKLEESLEEKARAKTNSQIKEVIAPKAADATTEQPVMQVEQGQKERRKFRRRKSDKAATDSSPQQSLEVRVSSPLAGPVALFGSYRVDQEVGKLVLGQPHRMDVLASRAPDDRRAIETSLVKALTAPEADEDSRRRARRAFEDYGFLARHSAALLLAQDTYERIAAARTLGEIGLPSALPFLLEALYDTDAIVRTQAVSSIGALKIPSAIGALLDMARRYPEMSNALLGQTLNACTFESLDFGGAFETEHSLLSGDLDSSFNGEIVSLEPSAGYEQLPEFLEDETLAEALERLGNTDVEVRTAAARRLAQFQTQHSVAALTVLASQDEEPLVRATAVSSLGEIDHESVFASVLLAFADEAREVQAAAARALSRLNFNRADAYVRLIETADEEALGHVARACIKARMAAQAIDRLASEDRRQAYEAFSLLSLLARANETAPILDAIAEHQNPQVQMAAIRLLGMSGRPEIAQQFRQLAVRDGLQEDVRTSLLEVVYKIDQALPV